jgi:hypothetical protein
VRSRPGDPGRHQKCTGPRRAPVPWLRCSAGVPRPGDHGVHNRPAVHRRRPVSPRGTVAAACWRHATRTVRVPVAGSAARGGSRPAAVAVRRWRRPRRCRARRHGCGPAGGAARAAVARRRGGRGPATAARAGMGPAGGPVGRRAPRSGSVGTGRHPGAGGRRRTGVFHGTGGGPRRRHGDPSGDGQPAAAGHLPARRAGRAGRRPGAGRGRRRAGRRRPVPLQ